VIKWLVIGVLVAGTFGVVWTAPWKNNVDTLRKDVTEQLGGAWGALGLRADNGACDALARPPDASDRAAFDFVLEQLRKNPDAKLFKIVAASQPTTTVREFAHGAAGELAGCFAKVPRRAKGWDDLKRRLDAGIAAAAPG